MFFKILGINRTLCTLAIFLQLIGTSALGQAIPSPKAGSGQVTEITALERRLDYLEKSSQGQIAGISSMVQMATLIFAIVSGAFAVFGVGTYISLINEIRQKFESQLTKMQAMEGELNSKLAESEVLRRRVQDLVNIQEDLTPGSLLAQAQSEQDNSLIAKYLSMLGRMSTASADELFSGALIAKERLENEGLSKSLLARAKERGGGKYLIEAVIAELHAQDSDWEAHKDILDELVRRHPQDSSLLAAAANFFIARGDWEGLEANMARAEAQCPWLSLPPRNRGRAAEQMNKDSTLIKGHYTRAINNSTPLKDVYSYRYFASYLMNGMKPRTQEDISLAIDILEAILKVNPEEGESRLDLAKLLILKGDDLELAKQQLQLGTKYCTNIAKRREGEALLEAFVKTV
jgi:hypothetical protein